MPRALCLAMAALIMTGGWLFGFAASAAAAGQGATTRAGSEFPAESGQRWSAAIGERIRSAVKHYQLKAIIVQVTSDGRNIYTGALGESMTGVKANPAMHFRNGAMAFTYMATLLLELVDQHKVTLDSKLPEFLPNLPYADRITLIANCAEVRGTLKRVVR